MNAFLLALMISSVTGNTAESIPLGIYTSPEDCVEIAAKIIDADVLKDEHDVWCIPVKLKDGYANQQGGEVELL